MTYEGTDKSNYTTKQNMHRKVMGTPSRSDKLLPVPLIPRMPYVVWERWIELRKLGVRLDRTRFSTAPESVSLWNGIEEARVVVVGDMIIQVT